MELFIDRTTALYIGETKIRVVTNEGYWRKDYTMRRNAISVFRGMGMKD